jgi:hypothetical protein
VNGYLAAALLARTGDEGSKVALMLLALAVASPSVGGYAVACLMAPHVLAAPLMGRWIDRSEHPNRVIGLACVAFAGFLAIGAAGMGRLPDPLVLVLLLVAGAFGPAVTGGLSSLLRLFTSEERLPRAFGLDSLTFNIAGMVGPAGAAMVAVAAPRTACYLVAATTAAAAIPLLAMRAPQVTARAVDEGTPRATLLGGLHSVVANRPLALATAATSLAQVGFGALVVVVPVRAHALDAPQWAGWWFTALAGGAFVGSLVWSVRPAPAAYANRVVMAALAVSGAALLGTLVGGPWVIAAFMALAGFATGPQFGALQVVRNRGATAQDRAGVFTLAAGVKVAAAALGTAAAGQLVALPLSTILLAAALMPLIAGVTGLLLGADRSHAS